MVSAVTDIMVVKGERCLAGYLLLATSPGGHNVSLSRGLFKSGVYLCVKKEDLSCVESVVVDVAVIASGRDVAPAGYVQIESRAGVREPSVYVKRGKKSEATQCVSDVICVIPAKKDVRAGYKIINKPIGNDGVCLAYQLTALNPTQAPPPVPPRSTSGFIAQPTGNNEAYPNMGVYPQWGSTIGPTQDPPEHAKLQSNIWASEQLTEHMAYEALKGVPVEVAVPESEKDMDAVLQLATSSMPQITSKAPQEIDEKYNYDFAVERSILLQSTT